MHELSKKNILKLTKTKCFNLYLFTFEILCKNKQYKGISYSYITDVPMLNNQTIHDLNVITTVLQFICIHNRIIHRIILYHTSIYYTYILVL